YSTSTVPAANDSCWVAYDGSPAVNLGTGDGSKTAYLFLRDPAGNVTNPPSSDTVILDQTAPTVPTGISVSAGHRSATVTWTASTDTGGIWLAGYEVTLRRPPLAPVVLNSATPTVTFSGLSDGRAYQFSIRSYDLLGNYSVPTALLSVTPKPAWQFIARRPTTANLNGVWLGLSSLVVAGEVGTLRLSGDGADSWQTSDTGADVPLRFVRSDTSNGLVLSGGANGTLGFLVGSAFTPILVTGTPDIYDMAEVDTVTPTSSGGPATEPSVTAYYAYVGEGAAGYGQLTGSDTNPANPLTLTMEPATLPTMSGNTILRGVTGCSFTDVNDGSLVVSTIAVGDNLNGTVRTGVILSSADHGQSYSQGSLPTGYSSMVLRGVVTTSAGILFAAGSSTSDGTTRTALLTSSDCGSTWSAVSGAPLDSISVYGVAATASGPNSWKIWLAGRAADPSTGVEGSTGKLISYDVASGTATNVPGVGAPLSAVTGVNNTTLFVVGTNGYVALTDGTTVTEKSAGQLTTWRAASFYEDATDTTVWYVGDGTQVAKSTTGADGGVSFASVSPGISGVELGAIGAQDSTGLLYASERITDGGFVSRIYISDGGTFVPMTNQPANLLHDLKCKYGNCYAVGQNAVLNLNAGGWAPVGSGPPPTADLVAVAPLPNSGVAAVGSALGGGFGQPFVYVYANGSVNSGNQPFGGPFTAIDSNEFSNLLIGGRGTVFFGIRMGPSNYTWISRNLNAQWYGAQVRSVASGGGQVWYAVLDTGDILKSTDDGSSFVSVTPPTGGKQLYGLIAGTTVRSTLYAVGESGTVVMSSSGGQ
ncbi:MAG: fibronectin type III domain-containing protein, partial [Myxococcaceae bacterium]